MPRVDDYVNAAELGRKALQGVNPERIAEESGARYKLGSRGDPVLTLAFLGRDVSVFWPDMIFRRTDSDEEVPIQQQVILLHYLKGAMGSRVTGEWIAYQEVPDGKFYLDAFQRRAVRPLVQVFGESPGLLTSVAEDLYQATPVEQGDVGVRIQALPKVPVVCLLWKGDDEFPPDGTVLFDKGIVNMLSAEDIAWLSGMVVYPLIGRAKSRG